MFVADCYDPERSLSIDFRFVFKLLALIFCLESLINFYIKLGTIVVVPEYRVSCSRFDEISCGFWYKFIFKEPSFQSFYL